jgi:threonine dehydrogenase-like Zn-dependent dehydrogenase
MRALWFQNGRAAVRRDLSPPEPAAGEALVRVLLAGVCGTDLELLRGYGDFTGVPGHEFVGVVERGPDELVGRRVVGEINVTCGACALCRRGLSNHCTNRTVMGIVGRPGAFADFVCLPCGNLHPVPDGMTTEVAVFTEPLAAALEIQEQIDLAPGSRVLVVGDGRLGQLVARTLRRAGCELTVAGRHPGKLGLLEGAGIRTVLPGGRIGAGFDVAVECTGNPEGFECACRSLRPRGTLVLKSTYAGRADLDLTPLVVDEITLVGSRCGPFVPALEMLAAGRIPVEPLIQHRLALDEAVRALELASKPGVLKVLLDMEHER